MKLQHLLISAFTYSFKVINPDSAISNCIQFKMILCSVLEEILKNKNFEKIIMLIDLKTSKDNFQKEILLHIILNKHFHLIFSKREIKDYGKRLYKIKKSLNNQKFKNSIDFSYDNVFNYFLKHILSFCIWDYDSEFEEKRRLFCRFPRLDMKSFSEFIETNYIKNKIFSCSELFLSIKEIKLPLNQTTGIHKIIFN